MQDNWISFYVCFTYEIIHITDSMKNNEYNSSIFLQMDFIENFAYKKKINWERYLTKDSGVFSINELKGMEKNDENIRPLSDQSLQITRKIIKQAKHSDEIELSRKELTILKFYSSISCIKAQKLKNDSWISELMKHDGRTYDEIAEEQIQIIMQYFYEIMVTISLENMEKIIIVLWQIKLKFYLK